MQRTTLVYVFFSAGLLGITGCFGGGPSGPSQSGDDSALDSGVTTVEAFRGLPQEERIEAILAGQAPPEVLAAVGSIESSLAGEQGAYLLGAFEEVNEGLSEEYLAMDPAVQDFLILAVESLAAEGINVGGSTAYAWTPENQTVAAILGIVGTIAGGSYGCVALGGAAPACIGAVAVGVLLGLGASAGEMPEEACSEGVWIDPDVIKTVPRLGQWQASCTYTGTESCCSSCPITTSRSESHEVAVLPYRATPDTYCAEGYEIQGPQGRDLLACRATNGTMECGELRFGFDIHEANVTVGGTNAMSLNINEKDDRVFDGAGNSQAEIGTPCHEQTWDCSVVWVSYEL